jgi:hypothetical protein
MNGSYGLSEFPKSEPVIPPSSHEIPSSPPSIASDAGVRRKPKRPPTVTPRTMKRFFTPRSMLSPGNSGAVKTNRQALKSLSSPAVNRLGPAFTRTPKPIESQPAVSEPAAARTPPRKRKLSFSSVGSPLQSSPLKKVHRVRGPVRCETDDQTAVPVKEIEVVKGTHKDGAKPGVTGEQPAPVSPIHRSSALQSSGGLYMRSVFGSRANRTTIRSNSGTGWSSIRVRPCDSNSPCSRLEGFDLNFLFPARRQSQLH